MHGTIQDKKLVYKRKVAVTPNVHSYQEGGGVPYQKFTCPVCDAVGNTHIGLPHGIRQCPLCQVRLNWTRHPKTGDHVVLTVATADLPAGTKGVLMDAEAQTCQMRPDGEAQTYQIPATSFSILVGNE